MKSIKELLTVHGVYNPLTNKTELKYLGLDSLVFRCIVEDKDICHRMIIGLQWFEILEADRH